MNTLPRIPLLLLAPLIVHLGACESTTTRPVEPLDTALMRFLDEDGRAAVAEARRIHDEAVDAVAAARLEVEQARADLAIARQERDVATARLEKVRTTAAPAEPSVEPNDPRLGHRDQVEVRDARFGVVAADDRIAWRRDAVESAGRHVDLLEARAKLAAEKIELVKAQALRRIGRPEIDAPALTGIESSVRRHDTDVRVAEVRYDAARHEVEMSKKLADLTIEERRERQDAVETTAVRDRR